jgi:hypothetical protein
MSAQPQTISLGLAASGVHGAHLKTLLASPRPPAATSADRPVTLAPFAAWIAALN